jgi:hypothetical protein
LLGPEHVKDAAGLVRFSLGWSGLDIMKAMEDLDDGGKLPSQEPAREGLSLRAEHVSRALEHFNRVAADEIQDRRLRRLVGRFGWSRDS